MSGIVCAVIFSGSVAAEQPRNLYAQAASALLQRNFSSSRTEYLLLDLYTHQTVALHWANPEAAIPVGSMLKPFVALAYSQMHRATQLPLFPAIRCRGKADGCWKPGGHGTLTLEPALAESCNAYFLALARELAASGAGTLRQTSIYYGLAPPPDFATAQALIGITADWRIAPLALANAYALLASQGEEPTTRRLMRGMRMATGPGGTASKVGAHPGGVLAKTGTAPCRESSCVASGDGLAVVLAPAEEPRLLLLVRQRGTTGGQTAALAGRMLTQLEKFNAP